jgi:hypothetical protein
MNGVNLLVDVDDVNDFVFDTDDVDVDDMNEAGRRQPGRNCKSLVVPYRVCNVVALPAVSISTTMDLIISSHDMTCHFISASNVIGSVSVSVVVQAVYFILTVR